ncbi:MAG: hypothetical protein LBE91_08435 [Tannerella sp.]|nr:hypothetical protein [Tannerella sp.]
MSTSNILNLIVQLPLTERFVVLEQTLKSIKDEEFRRTMTTAADRLYDDYTSDSELTAFTSLDYEDFYEAR